MWSELCNMHQISCELTNVCFYRDIYVFDGADRGSQISELVKVALTNFYCISGDSSYSQSVGQPMSDCINGSPYPASGEDDARSAECIVCVCAAD